MKNEEDVRQDLEYWADMWDSMQDQGIATDKQYDNKPINTKPEFSFQTDNSAQDDYYNYLDSEELLQESKSANPVYPDSVGTDQKKPKSNWVSEDLLTKVEELKSKLFKIENKLAKMGQGSKEDNADQLLKQINSIHKQISKVSNRLGMKDEYLPYEFRKGK
jgi:hypothetical protein